MKSKSRTILAIETSCDETAAAVIKDGKILSSIIASQADLHSKYGGVVPEVAAREHVPTIIPTIDLALKEAKIKLNDIGVVAVTKGPGLATSLHVGIDAAKTLALVLNKPLLPVNHMEAHIYANFVEPETDFPALILIVSGGHTLLVLMKKHGQYEILGETMDDAAGEAFDKTAKLLGLGYPGGPQISKYAVDGNTTAFNFPRPMIKSNNLDFSFSGLKTAVLYEVQKHPKIDKKLKQDIAASVQVAIVETLIRKLEQAAKKYKPKTLMLGGGVAANKMLREEFLKLANKLNVNYSIPPLVYCTDNAAMIGLAAYYRIKNKKARFAKDFGAEPNLPLK
ncbi:MAG TPA: tRNA (adenosine(37)-N6)-threonylcarbamoyltransferase complex transferase subunit TsaD [Candidatus Binatia bacterium]|nr:tRNA (adenosine(37)-N6)-threonylcarbamoyltransferase complex transferase subunit TsaD [Candidatus Binatia bacterium]